MYRILLSFKKKEVQLKTELYMRFIYTCTGIKELLRLFVSLKSTTSKYEQTYLGGAF